MVYLFLAEGHESVEALTPVDLLRRANIEIKTVSITGSETVCGSSGVKIIADTLFENVDFSDATAIILPGGMPGTTNLLAHVPLCDLILNMYNNDKYVFAICAAPMILSKIGINEKMSIYPTFKDKVMNFSNDKLCVLDKVITANALGSAIDFSLEIIKKLQNDEVASKVANSIVY